MRCRAATAAVWKTWRAEYCYLCKEVMLSSIFVCLLAGLYAKIFNWLHKIRWKSGSPGRRKKPLDFGGNPQSHYARVGLGIVLWFRLAGSVRYPVCCRLHGVCLTVTVLRYQRPWQRYALYWVPFYSSFYIFTLFIFIVLYKFLILSWVAQMHIA